MRSQELREPKLPQEGIVEIRERHKNTVLSDDDVITLVIENKPDDPDALGLWLGGVGIYRNQTPVFRFSEILNNRFSALADEQKAALIKGSANFVLKTFTEREGYGVTQKPPFYRGSTSIEYERYGQRTNEITNRRNIGALLLKTLEFTDNDIVKSRQLLKLTVSPKTRPSNYGTLSVFALSSYAGEVSQEAMERKDFKKYKKLNDELISANPKIQELAFWVEADLGHMRPALFDHLFGRIYPKVDGRIKTQIMIYLKEQVIAKSVPEKYIKDIRLFLAGNEKLYDAVRSQYPNSPFIEATDTLKAVLIFDDIIEKTKDGKIEVEEMLSMIDKFPELIEAVTKEELDLALNLTKDHGVALRIERLIRLKSTPSFPKEIQP